MTYLLHLQPTTDVDDISFEGDVRFIVDGHEVIYYKAKEIIGNMVISAELGKSKERSHHRKYILDEIDAGSLRDYNILYLHSRHRHIEMISVKRSESSDGDWQKLKVGNAYRIEIEPIDNNFIPIRGYKTWPQTGLLHRDSVYLRSNHFYTCPSIKDRVIQIR